MQILVYTLLKISYVFKLQDRHNASFLRFFHLLIKYSVHSIAEICFLVISLVGGEPSLVFLPIEFALCRLDDMQNR